LKKRHINVPLQPDSDEFVYPGRNQLKTWAILKSNQQAKIISAMAAKIKSKKPNQNQTS
jgi:hypothetical protein